MIKFEYVDTISHETVRTALKKTNLSLGKEKSGASPQRNAEFVCQMEEILDIYKQPYDVKCPVVCMDESSKQLRKERVI